jgi:hypothetical protein
VRLWKLDNAIIQKVLFEIEQIDQLIFDSTPLFELCKIREPDFVERCGIALILQSFYNGIENIMLLIIKNTDTVLPNGIKWHKDLFAKTFERTENRSEIFREELKTPLNDYLQFRHFVRHTYGFQLKWEKMKNILFDMNMIWEKTKEDINIFIKKN